MVGEVAGAIEVAAVGHISLEALVTVISKTVSPGKMGPASHGKAGVPGIWTIPPPLAVEATGDLAARHIFAQIGVPALGKTV